MKETKNSFDFTIKLTVTKGDIPTEDRRNALRISDSDNVAVALADIKKNGKILAGGLDVDFMPREDIGKGHKIACVDIAEGDAVVKYGFPIGFATKSIKAGEWVHTHNIRSGLAESAEYTYRPEPFTEGKRREACFSGYVREDGKVGVRNEIWIVNTVGCVNKTAELIAKEAGRRFDGMTDGVYSFPHPYGCSQLGDDLLNTQKILAGLVRHPNAAGVLVLGLGCENNLISEFRKVLGEYDERRVMFLEVQKAGDEVQEGLRLIEKLCAGAAACKRQPCPVSKLAVGLKCGGSDAFSGITANPLVGRFSDLLVSHGGISILTEIPEMFGAETILMDRCADRTAFDGMVEAINRFKLYYTGYGQKIYENPSPGNKKGGISTLEEKSLGCVQKGGTGRVKHVSRYGETVPVPGLNVLEAPGNDMIAATALAAAGAQIILFTTGRGTPFGTCVPTIKISSNTELHDFKSGWIDFDAGRILDGVNMDAVAGELFEYVIKVASGEAFAKNERNGYREIAIFKDGVIL